MVRIQLETAVLTCEDLSHLRALFTLPRPVIVNPGSAGRMTAVGSSSAAMNGLHVLAPDAGHLRWA